MRVRGADHAQSAHGHRALRAARRRVEPPERAHQGAHRASVSAGGRRSVEAIREPRAAGADELWGDDVHQDREQVEHRAYWAHDVLPRSGRAHAGTAGSAREVREQDSNARENRAQQQNAVAVPARRVLHAQGNRRPRHALHGPHFDPSERPEVQHADGHGRDALPQRHVQRHRPAHPQPVPLHPALGGGVHRLAARVGRVRAEAAGGAGAEPPVNAGGFGGLLGPRHSAHQHFVPEGPAHARLRQRMARAHALQGALPVAAEPVLVDARQARRETLEPEQLSHGRDPGFGRRGGHSGAHALQRDVLSHLGGSVLGESQRVRGEHEVQEADQRAEERFEPNPQPKVHAVVVADDQPRQRVRGVPSSARFDGHLHARQDPHAEDLAHPDLPRALVAEDPRVRRHGLVSGVRPGARRAGD